MPNLSEHEPEAALLTAVASGDRVAFSQLYDRMQPRVLGLSMRILRDISHAEEVSQEVFLEVWQLAATFDASKGSAISWILRKAHSRAIDRVRSSQTRRARDLRVGVRDLAEPSSDILETVALKINSEKVSRALGALPVTQREAVSLAHLGGYSHSEVSEMLQVPIGTVKTRIRAGIDRLRVELAAA
ncbi:MAG TPA: sigma-70 family RNA polymerase sigma factor [Galbitalea sp.]|jgi:RNA polymerase sigma-70 factor (ECF subfamily)|nr:sigma-70 family RNA polymerase sigma factor [Galbitalea sp.]